MSLPGAQEGVEVQPEQSLLTIETKALEQSFADLGTFQIPAGRLTEIRLALGAVEVRSSEAAWSPVEIAEGRNPVVLAVDVEILKDTETQMILGLSVDGRLSLQGHRFLLSPKLVLLDASEFPVPRTRRPSCQGDCPDTGEGQSPTEGTSSSPSPSTQNPDDSSSRRPRSLAEGVTGASPPAGGEGSGRGDRGPQIPAASFLPPLIKGGEGGFIGAGEGGSTSDTFPSIGMGNSSPSPLEGEVDDSTRRGGGAVPGGQTVPGAPGMAAEGEGLPFDPDSDEVVHGALFACHSFEMDGRSRIEGDVELGGLGEMEGNPTIAGRLLLNAGSSLVQKGHPQITGGTIQTGKVRGCNPINLESLEALLTQRNSNARALQAAQVLKNGQGQADGNEDGQDDDHGAGGKNKKVPSHGENPGAKESDDDEEKGVRLTPDGLLAINLRGHDTLILPEGDYWIDTLKVEGKASLVAQGFSRFLVRSKLKIEGQGTVAPAGATDFLKIVVAGPEVSVEGKSFLNASLYAARSEVEVGGTALVKGDVFASRVEVEGNAQIVAEHRIQSLLADPTRLPIGLLWNLLARVRALSLHEAEDAVYAIIGDRGTYDGITVLYALQTIPHLSHTTIKNINQLENILLTDPEPQNRASAAHTLSTLTFGKREDLLTPLQEARMTETHPNVKAVVEKAIFRITGERTLEPRTRFDSVNAVADKGWDESPEPRPSPAPIGSEIGSLAPAPGRIIRDSFDSPFINSNLWIVSAPPTGSIVQENGLLKMKVQTVNRQPSIATIMLREFTTLPGVLTSQGFTSQVKALVSRSSTAGGFAAAFSITFRLEGSPGVRFIHFACGPARNVANSSFHCVLTDSFFATFLYGKEVPDFRGSAVTFKFRNDPKRKKLVFSVPELEVAVDLPLGESETLFAYGFETVALPGEQIIDGQKVMLDSFVEIHWDEFRMEFDPEGVEDDFDDEGFEEDWTGAVAGNATLSQGGGTVRMVAVAPSPDAASAAKLTLKRLFKRASFAAAVKLRVSASSFGFGGAGMFNLGLKFGDQSGENVAIACSMVSAPSEGLFYCTPFSSPGEVDPSTGEGLVKDFRGMDLTLIIQYDDSSQTASLQVPELGLVKADILVTPAELFTVELAAVAIVGTLDVQWDDFIISFNVGYSGSLPELQLENVLYTNLDGAFVATPKGELKPIYSLDRLMFVTGAEPLNAALVLLKRDVRTGIEERATVYSTLNRERLRDALFETSDHGVLECFSESIFSPAGLNKDYRWTPSPCMAKPNKVQPPEVTDAEDEGCLPSVCPEETPAG